MENLKIQKDLAEGNFVKTFPKWLRWILFFPAAVACALIFSILFKLSAVFFLGDTGFFVDLMQNAILGMVFVYVGALIAPRNQFGISILMLVIITIFSVFSVLGSALPNSSVGFWSGLTSGLVVLFAAGATVFALHKEVE